MDREPKKAITIRLTAEQYATLSQLAKQSNRSLSSSAVQMIKRYLICLENDAGEKARWNIV